MSVSAVYELRMNAEGIPHELVITELRKIAKKFVFQLEKGEKTGYLHYQGRISLIKKTTQQAALKLFDGLEIDAPEYLQPTCNTEAKSEAFYCMKEQTRQAGPWTEKDEEEYIPKQYRNIKLHPFQQTILDSRKVEDNRCINIIFDEKGNNGKSTVAAIAELKYGAIDLPPINDAQSLMEVMYGECNIRKNPHHPGLVFIDMPRSMNKDTLAGIYSAIEQIKKGKVYDLRYSYKKLWIDSPIIWVFTNTFPDLKALSADRWKFWSICNNNLEPLVLEDAKIPFKKRLIK